MTNTTTVKFEAKGKKHLFITDMDGTLTKGSIVLEHAGFLIEKDLIQDDGSYQAWNKDRKNEKLIVAVAENYRKEITGKTIEQLHVDEFIQLALNNKDNWYSTLDMLKAEKAKGNDVVIISGSSNFLVQGVAKALGFNGIGTWYYTNEEGKLTGEVKGMFGYEAKEKWINENIAFTDYGYIVGLGDTSSDFAIFNASQYNILVEPTAETLEQALEQKIQIDEILHK